MKKITLLFVFAVMSMATQAQEIIERPITSERTGMPTVKGNTSNILYLSDYFEISEETTLGNLDVMGFGLIDNQTNGLLTFADYVTGFNVYIYEDNNGTPAGSPISGGELHKMEDIQDTNYTIVTEDENDPNVLVGDFTEIDLTAANGGTEIVLEAGSYWITVLPSVSGGSQEDASQWVWFGSDTPAAHSTVVLAPEQGVANWMDLGAALGEPWNTQAWILRDETALAVAGNFDLAEMVSVYPNPTSDFVQLNLPSDIEVNSVQLFDLLGKKIDVALNNNQIDLSSYADGVYMLNIETNQGKLTKKIIKK